MKIRLSKKILFPLAGILLLMHTLCIHFHDFNFEPCSIASPTRNLNVLDRFIEMIHKDLGEGHLEDLLLTTNIDINFKKAQIDQEIYLLRWVLLKSYSSGFMVMPLESRCEPCQGAVNSIILRGPPFIHI